jgi:hypothetical protein
MFAWGEPPAVHLYITSCFFSNGFYVKHRGTPAQVFVFVAGGPGPDSLEQPMAVYGRPPLVMGTAFPDCH